MRKSIDLRKRVGKLIEALKAVPVKHRTPAMEMLLTDLQRAADTYDSASEE